MQRSLVNRLRPLLCLAGLLGSLSGCTLFAGEPWGELQLALAARFSPPDSRLSADGALKTAKDYALDLEELWLDVDAVSLAVSADGARRSFDPARPPPGYSLCHGGHCHADDGRLVDYAEIERALFEDVGARLLQRAVLDDELALSAEPASLSLAPCEPDCWLERGVVSSLAVSMTRLFVRGTVFDLREGGAARLPAEGVALQALVEGPLRATVELAVPVDGSEPSGLSLAAVLSLPPSLFDDVDFASLTSAGQEPLSLDEESAESVIDRVADSEIDVSVTRSALERPFTPLLLSEELSSETP